LISEDVLKTDKIEYSSHSLIVAWKSKLSNFFPIYAVDAVRVFLIHHDEEAARAIKKVPSKHQSCPTPKEAQHMGWMPWSVHSRHCEKVSDWFGLV
jgi:hypothetical protein